MQGVITWRYAAIPEDSSFWYPVYVLALVTGWSMYVLASSVAEAENDTRPPPPPLGIALLWQSLQLAVTVQECILDG